MNTIQSMWTERTIGTIERLSIASYLHHSMSYHLYLYHDVPGVPTGAIIHDANEIVPESEVKGFRHPQQFADYFRYAMLLRNGGWHADLDTVCLKPFDITAPYVFVRDNIGKYCLNGSFIKTPPASAIMRYCFNSVSAMSVDHRVNAGYMAVGPDLMYEAVHKFYFHKYVQPKVAFDPIPYTEITKIVDPAVIWDLTGAYAIHLRASIWNNGPNKAAGVLPSGNALMSEETYPAGCLFEQLKARYL